MNDEETSPENEHLMSAEMFDALIKNADANVLPLVMMPSDGQPLESEFYLAMMRLMITTSGSATACITFSTTTGSTGMLPLIGIDPQTGLRLLLSMREQQILDSIAWVTVASDAYTRVFDGDVDPGSIHRGDLERMRKAGDPSVKDVLMVVCVTPDGPGFETTQGYRKTDTGIEWEEALPMSERDASTYGPVKRLMSDLVTT